MSARSRPVVIVGGGVSGLTAAAELGRLKVPAVVLDHEMEIEDGRRAHRHSGFPVNVGPRRLYREGAAVHGLMALNVPIALTARGSLGGFAVRRGRRFTLPIGACSLLTTGLLGASAKREMARVMTSLDAIRPADLDAVSVDSWLRAQSDDRDVVELLQALVRSTTCCDDLDRLSASAAVDQLRLSLGGCVHCGHDVWSALLASLVRMASTAGAIVVRGRPAIGVDIVNGWAENVAFDDGSRMRCAAVIVATDPRMAARLLGTAVALQPPTPPVRVAALDVALRALPDPRTVFAIGIDEPWCYSAESAVARVSPDYGAVVQVAKYLRAGAAGGASDEQHLEQTLDLLQPGWRTQMIDRRFLPTVTVSHALVSADAGGFAGRQSGSADGVANLFLAGDWIGPVGQMIDASVSSGIAAARRAARVIANGGAGAHRAC